MFFSSIKNTVLRVAARVLTFTIIIIVLLLSALSIYVRYNKASLLVSIQNTISKNISGTVKIRDIDVSTLLSFPYIAVNLQDVQLLDTLYNKPLLECKEISCRISLFKVGDVQHQLSRLVIKQGSINLFTDTVGYSNVNSIFPKSTKEKPANNQAFIVHNIELVDMRFIIHNEQRKKDFDFNIENLDAALENKDSLLLLSVREKIMVNQMVFNRNRGSYLEHNKVEGEMNLHYNRTAKTLQCDKSDLNINGQPQTISAMFRFENASSFYLDIASKKLKYEKGIEALTPRLRQKLSAIQLKEPIALHAVIEGPLSNGANPLVNVTWETKENQFGSGPVIFDECSFNGNFTNHTKDTLPLTDEFSIITMQSFAGKWHGLLLTGKDIKVVNLVDPVVTFNLSSSATLPDIDDAIGSEALTFLEGKATVNLYYNGPLVADPSQLKNLNARFQISDGKIIYEPRNVLLEKCSGLMAIEGNQLAFKDFQFDFKRNHFSLNLQGNEMSNLSNNLQQKAALQIGIHSPYVHLDEILQILSVPQKKKSKKIQPHFAVTANKIDDLLANSNWVVNATADKISKGNFYAQKLNADIKLQENHWDIEHVIIYHADGIISAKGQLNQQNARNSGISAAITLQHLNIQKLLAAFDNFGQTSVTSANLKGTLNADANISASINNNTGKVVPGTVTGVLNFSLKNGAIIHHKGLEEMKLLFLKNRDMSDVRFAELKDRIDLKPTYMYINKMEIQSSAISMYIEGQYDVYGKNTDLLIQVPFSNFGKRDETAIPLNKGVDAKTGLSIWIGAKNNDKGEIKFTPRLSKKKFKKDKENPD
ncbi:hypothetical protein BH11BAC6_BH11BAC6_02040 [soil metagenome]